MKFQKCKSKLARRKEPVEKSWTFPPPGMKFLPWQKNFIDSYDPAVAGRWILCSARGIGKTTGAAAYLLINAHKLFYSRPKDFPRRGHLVRAVYLAPTTKNMLDTLNIFNGFLTGFPKNQVKHVKSQDNSLHSYTFYDAERGIEIIFASARNASNWRGRTMDICVIDEMAMIGVKKEGGKFITTANSSDGKNLLDSVVEPACIRPYTAGTIVLASTPFYGNFFDQIVTSAETKEGLYKDYSVSHLTYKENLLLTEEQKEAISEKEFYIPSKFKVEYMAQVNVIYKNDSMQELRQFSDELCTTAFTRDNTLHNSKKVYALAVDLAFRGVDKCTFVVLDIYAKTVVHLQYFATSSAEDIVKKILELKKLFNISSSKIAIDVTGKGKSILPLLPVGIRDAATKVIFNGATKKTMYDSLTIRMGIDLKIPYYQDFNFAILPNVTAKLPDMTQTQKSNFQLLYLQFIDFWRMDYPKYSGGVEQIYSEWVQSEAFGDDFCDAVAMVGQFLPPLDMKKEKQNLEGQPKKQTLDTWGGGFGTIF